MKITSVELGTIAAAGREKRVVTVRVKLAQPQESMRITVVVPEDSDDASAREYGVARAMDAARQFCCSGAGAEVPVRTHVEGHSQAAGVGPSVRGRAFSD
jgi:hypothetical protein